MKPDFEQAIKIMKHGNTVQNISSRIKSDAYIVELYIKAREQYTKNFDVYQNSSQRYDIALFIFLVLWTRYYKSNFACSHNSITRHTDRRTDRRIERRTDK